MVSEQTARKRFKSVQGVPARVEPITLTMEENQPYFDQFDNDKDDFKPPPPKRTCREVSQVGKLLAQQHAGEITIIPDEEDDDHNGDQGKLAEQEAEEEQKETEQDADYELDAGELEDIGDNKGDGGQPDHPQKEEKPEPAPLPKVLGPVTCQFCSKTDQEMQDVKIARKRPKNQ